MQIDKKFTDSVIAWLGTEHKTEANVIDGAQLLYRIIPNNALNQQIMRRPLKLVDKVIYELKKHVAYRLDGLTLDGVKIMDAELTPVIEEAVSVPTDDTKDELPSEDTSDASVILARGKREDHDSLPDDIKALWTNNAARWKKIKETFETCKTLTMSCDRYEYLKVLKETWYAYKADMKKYDEYKVGTADNTDASAAVTQDVNNARSYISKNLAKLSALDVSGTDDDKAKAETIKVEIQKRVDIIVAAGAAIKEDTIKELEALGITVYEQGTADKQDTDTAEQ